MSSSETGYDFESSSREGIELSTVVLACLNQTIFVGRDSCMPLELAHAADKRKKIIALVLEDISSITADQCEEEGNGAIGPRRRPHKWQPIVDLIDRIRSKEETMYCDVSEVAQDSRWKCDEDSPPADLVEKLKKKTEELVEILKRAGCELSMPLKKYEKKQEWEK